MWEVMTQQLTAPVKSRWGQAQQFLQSALTALALESHTKLQARDLKSLTTKMQAKTNGSKQRKKRRAASVSA